MTARDDTATLRILAVAMTLQFAIGGAVMPFVSVYLRDQALSFSQISLIFTCSSATLMVSPFLWGMLADRYIPLNRLFAVMNGVALLGLAAFAWQKVYLGLLVSFMFFQASFNPTMMLINPLCFHHLRNPREQFGALRSWGSVGWILPSLPIFLWLVGNRNTDLTFALVLAITLCLAMVVYSFRLPHTPPGAAPTGFGAEPRLGYWPAMKRLFHNVNYVVVLVSFFLIVASFSLYIFYSPPRLEELGMKRAWIGPVQCSGVVLEIVLFRWRSLFLHRLNYTATLTIGCLALALRHALFAWSDQLWVLTASYLLVGVVIVFYHIGASLLVNSIAGPEVRSTAQTLLLLCGSGLGPVFSNFVAGRLTAGSGDDLQPIFWFGAGLAALAAALILSRGGKLDREARER